MRYAVFSDVHANLEAFCAVVEFFSRSRIDRYLFVGDIVGYGADPGPCLDLLKRLDPVMVAGNHDGAVAGRFSEDDFNEAAAAAILWTRGNMGLAEKQFLAQLRPVCEASEFCLVHGTLAHPEQFEYMLDVKHAKSTFELLKQKCCFVGHTHFPSLFVQDGAKIFQKDVSVSTASVRGELRAIVNCGSVGQPRDKDPRACCCIFDSDQASVTWHRVSYDHRSAARKIRQAGLPLSLADRLALGY